MTEDTPVAPRVDPECGVSLRALLDGFGGAAPSIDVAALAVARRTPSLGSGPLLTNRRFTERKATIGRPEADVALSVFTPEEHEAPAAGIVWIHGGGFIVGDRFLASEALDIAVKVGAVVVSVEYRLAPEHPSPAALEDCLAALTWCAANSPELGIDPQRLILAGASAGGALAAGTALRARDEGGPVLAGLLLCSPMLDDRMTTVSSHQFDDDVIWTPGRNEFGWRSFLGDRLRTDAVTAFEAPGRARDLSGLPPTYIDVGSVDLFRDEDVAFASTVWACGGEAELHVWPGGYHGFEIFAPSSALAIAATEARSRWLTRTLSHTSS